MTPPHHSVLGRPIITEQTVVDTARSIELELVNMFYRKVHPGILAFNVLLASLLVGMHWPFAAHETVLAWLGAVTGVTVLRWMRYRRYQKFRMARQVDVAAWRRVFGLGSFINGVLWGMGGILLYLPAAPLQSTFVLLVLCGIAASIVASQSALMGPVHGFMWPAFVLPAAYILSLGGLHHVLVAGLLVMYLGFMLFIGMSNHRTLADSVSLRFENAKLLGELVDSERQFRSLIEAGSDLVTVMAADGTLLFQSPSSKAVLGYDPAEMEGRSAYEFIHPEDRPLIEADLERVLREPGTTATAEIRWRHKGGRWVLLQGIERRMADTQPPVAVVNARDTTERHAMEADLRRAKEEAEAASRVKARFLASMSHEIRTPLHAILGMAEVLKDTQLDPQQARYVGAFHSAGEHLLGLINDILDFSRIEAGGLHSAREAFHLPNLIDEVDGLLGVQAVDKGLILRCTVTPGLAPWRQGDVRYLRQVIVNLVGNAIKFTRSGEVALAVAPAPEGGDMLRFTVTDTGEGIPREKQSLLFQPFTQIDATLSREHGGTGLGLAISRRLVNAMGGTIGVDSAPGKGSTFYFSLPLPETDSGVAGDRVEEDLIDVTTLPPARILVADDSDINRLVIKEFLHDCPCRLEFAANGQEAVEMFGREDYDMVLMDIQMPLMDGWTATRTIRRLEESRGRLPTPVVALTAGALEEDRRAALESGCTAFLPKPVGKGQLLKLLGKYLAAGGSGDEGEVVDLAAAPPEGSA